ncbi:hypothetical protein HAZT_HAZT011613 [Hyalella azteca]|uniref:Protein FAM32A n=1 Tax=Hyalella azteca TaxID=294128 RepID=A0A6A0H1D3_HYAAZ|nr:hypothetical protein HAZT_HAZT011613 [Hyalella azteca]
MLKKKKAKNAEKDAPGAPDVHNNVLVSSISGNKACAIQRTKAEMHFLKRQRQMEEDRIKKKASKSHKEKVEEFNRNLDSQSEHFDIPKVSWTK